VLRDGRLHQSDDVGRTDLTLGSQHMHFLSILIEYGEHAQGTAMNRGVGNTIPGPYMSAMVRLRRQPGGIASAGHIPPGGGTHRPSVAAGSSYHFAFTDIITGLDGRGRSGRIHASTQRLSAR